MLELYIKNNTGIWNKVDSDKELSIPNTYQITDFSKPDATKNSFSKTVELPGTANNNKILGEIYRLDYINTMGIVNPNKKIDFRLLNNGELIEIGYATLDKITKQKGVIKYSLTLYGGLGSFFYNLAYDNEGNELSLSDIYYGFTTANPFEIGFDNANTSTPIMKDLEKNTVLFNYNKSFVDYSWKTLKSASRDLLSDDNIYKVFTPIPMYTGYYDDFDNNKILFNQNIYNRDKQTLIIPYALENNTYSAEYTDGYCLIEQDRDMDQWETRDIRSHYLPLGVNVKYIYDKIKNSDMTNGFTIDDTDVNDSEKDIMHKMYLFNSPFDWKGITEARFEAGQQVTKFVSTEARSTERIYEVPFDMSEHSLYTITDVQQYIKDTQDDVDLSINIKVNQEYFVCMENAQEYQLKWWNDNSMRQMLIDNINSTYIHYRDVVDLRYVYYNFTIIKISSKISSTAWTNKYYVLGKDINNHNNVTDYDAFKERVRQYLISYCVSHFGIEPNTDYMFLDGEYGNLSYDSSRPDIYPRGNFSFNTTQAFGVFNKDNVSITIPLDHNTEEIKVSCYIGHYRRVFQGKIFLTVQSPGFNIDLDENIYTNCGLTLYGMMSQSPIYDRTIQNELPYSGNYAASVGMDLTSNHLCVINQCVNLDSWKIFYGDSLEETHELTKQNILGNTMSPYKFLKSLANLFNWKFMLELDTVKIYSADKFYTNEIKDISNDVDFDSVEILPSNVEYKDYIYTISDNEDLYPYYMYKKKYNIEYGKYKYTTDFNKNTNNYEYCDNNEFSSLPLWHHTGAMLYNYTDDEAKSGGYNNRGLMDSLITVGLWDSNKHNKTTTEVVGAYGRNPSKFTNKTDKVSKMTLFDKDNKMVNINNNICFFSGFVDIFNNATDKYGNFVNGYYLSDNTELMYTLNDKPCYIMDPEKTMLLQEIPLFSNNVDGDILTFINNGIEEPKGLNTLYNKYYKEYNEKLLNGDNRIITLKYRLKDLPYKAFRKFYVIEGNYYVLNKIIDYDQGNKNKFVKCEFISYDNLGVNS